MAWGNEEKEVWFKEQILQRSYKEEVLQQIEELGESVDILSYGRLSVDPDKYPLFLLKSKPKTTETPIVLITGGVHGYETSGVQGALAFFKEAVHQYSENFQIVCAPCISPWGYETINRWNSKAIDPNRSFYEKSPAEECQLFLRVMAQENIHPLAHFDLHETTDTDNTIFRPALNARDGVEQELTEIPDGFYLVGDSENPQKDFQKAIVDEVRKVTHIAPPDDQGRIIGEPLEQEGVINYPIKKLFLCAGWSQAKYTTTTEVYPDSPKVTPQNCIDAQVAALRGGLNYLAQVRDR